MNIGLYFYSIRNAGGAEKMICWLANELVQHGYNVIIFSLDSPNATSFYYLDSHICWIRLGIGKGLKDKIRRTFLLSKYFNFYHVKCLIGFVVSGDKTVFTAAKLTFTKLIVAERNAPSMYDIRYTKLQKYASFISMIFSNVITTQSKNFIDKYPRFLRSRMVAIPNPVFLPNEYSKPGVQYNGKYILLAVARLDELQKNLSCLISAFISLSADYPNWVLHVVGSGPDEKLYRSQIAESAMEERVKIFCETNDIRRHYLNSHLFVMPSRWEGFPNALAEAMAYGLPVVGFSQSQGVADLISSDTGWLAEGISDISSLAQTLSLAFKDNEAREFKGTNACFSMKNYTPEKQIMKWQEIINKLV